MEHALAALTEQLDRVGAGEDPVAVHAAQSQWHDTPWYSLLAGTTPETISFLSRNAAYDPIPALAALRCPLLAVFGADDLLVPVEPSMRAISATLQDAGHTDHTLIVFPHADHGVRVDAGQPPERVADGFYEPGQPAPGFSELVISWLTRRILCR